MIKRYGGVNTTFDIDLQRRVNGFRALPKINEKLLFSIISADGDTFESLAYKYYGSEQLWWVIADQNSLIHPFYITPGTILKVLKKEFLPAGKISDRIGE